MATVTLILGKSGSGKSTAMRNLSPASTALIQIIKKPLPFKGAKDWKAYVTTPTSSAPAARRSAR